MLEDKVEVGGRAEEEAEVEVGSRVEEEAEVEVGAVTVVLQETMMKNGCGTTPPI